MIFQSFATLLQIFIHRWNIASTLTVILVLKVLLLSSETVISNCLIGMWTSVLWDWTSLLLYDWDKQVIVEVCNN
jgi:hypothetical protein